MHLSNFSSLKKEQERIKSYTSSIKTAKCMIFLVQTSKPNFGNKSELVLIVKGYVPSELAKLTIQIDKVIM